MAEVVSFLTIPIISRIYSPKELGVYLFFTAASEILSTISTGKYEMAIMLPKKKNEAFKITYGTLYVSVMFCCLVFLLTLFFENQVSKLFNIAPIYSSSFLLLGVLLFSQNSYKTFENWNNYNKRFKISGNAKLIQKTSMSGLQIVFSSFGVFGLLWGRVLGLLISLIYMVRVKEILRFFRKNPTLSKKLLKKYSYFPKVMTPSSLINKTSYNIPNLTYSGMFTPTILGYYSMAYRFVALPVSIITNAVGQVFYKEVNELKNDKTPLFPILKRFYFFLIAAGTIPFILGFYLAPKFTVFVLGPQWTESGTIIQIIFPWLYLVYLNSPLTAILITIGKQNFLLLFELISICIKLAGVFIAYYLYNDFIVTTIVYAVIGGLQSATLLLFISHLVRAFDKNQLHYKEAK
jgi:O-antigen/teichoic acid export membrane protein